MPSGGRRTGAGRPKGSKNKPRQIVDIDIDPRDKPLDILMKIARDPTVDLALRIFALGKAAPFVHPRLHAIVIAKVNDPAPVNRVVVSPVPTGRYLSEDEARRQSGQHSSLGYDVGDRRQVIKDDPENPRPRRLISISATPTTLAMVMEIIVEELMLQDYEATIELLLRIIDAPTRH